jgi:hypothetical protein
MRFPKRIPTIVGIVLTLVLVAGVGVAFEYASRQEAQASVSLQPQKVEMTNISDTTFTVTWQTETPTSGTVIIGKGNEKSETLFDERDTSGKLGAYFFHSVSMRSATPSTLYQLTILSNGRKFGDGNKPFVVSTGPALTPATTGLEPAFGAVYTADNAPASGALVYLTLDGSQKLSTIVKSSGSWIIPLNIIRSSDLAGYIQSTDRLTENIIVRDTADEADVITDTLNDSPVPDITIGKTYDFRKTQAAAESAKLALRALTGKNDPVATTTPAVLGVQTPSFSTIGTTHKVFTISLTSPASGSALPTTLPLIAGTGFPNNTVLITLGITNPFSGTTNVGSDGLWKYTPVKPLGIGKQSVTITSKDDKGKMVAITHMFEILKSGTQVLGDATPSATLEPTATPEATITAEPTPVSTLSGQPMPTTGDTLPTILLILAGLALLLSGGAVGFINMKQ